MGRRGGQECHDYFRERRGKGVANALQYAIDNKTAPVISISYGECESMLGFREPYWPLRILPSRRMHKDRPLWPLPATLAPPVARAAFRPQPPRPAWR